MIFVVFIELMMISILVVVVVVSMTRYVSQDYIVPKEESKLEEDMKGKIEVVREFGRTRRARRICYEREAPRNDPLIYTYLISRLIWFVVECVRPSRFANVPVLKKLLRSETWRGMRVQNPSCVLYEPFPKKPRHTYICIAVLLLISTLYVPSAAMLLLLFVFLFELKNKNTYYTDENDDIIVIENGAYVGYEGIVFKLNSKKPWILTRGHADRSALLRLVRKQRKLYWRSDQDTMRCRLDTRGKIDPTLFCLQQNCNNNNNDNIHPRYRQMNQQRITNMNTKVDKVERYDTLIVIVQFHHGYFHWVTERVPTLYTLLPTIIKEKNAHILIDCHFAGHEDLKENQWSRQYINLVLPSNMQKRVVVYRNDRVYYANRVILLRDPVLTFHVNRNRLLRCRDHVSSLVSATSSSSSSSKEARCIVLIRRNNTAARQWCNIDDVAFALQERYGDIVRVVDFEEYSVVDQIRICRDKTSILVGIHGAGLANLIWCSSSCVGVVEILPSRPLFFRYLFWHLASSCGIPYVNIFVKGSWSSKTLAPKVDAIVNAVDTLM